ncbi:hypothetical protein [Chryseobacterium lathyri]|uniref:DUF4468 domain-containing protein n=1 Tax=Chryseobacterium lathyri TaxID=395933 RepID=A0ABT9SPA3_9FLAO|nr:hypothetical protein [Chryseobacterium lathyri]MDP9961268.1 hypothetical protein [Chryseobacterium lathyri]
MRKICILFLFVSFISSFAQVSNFSLDNSQVQWQKVYETTLTQEEIISLAKDSGKFSVQNGNNENFSGSISELMADYKGAGYSGMSTTFYVQNSTISGKIKIDLKEDRYRVTVSNIVLTELYNIGFGSGNNKKVPFEYYVLRNNKSDFTSTFLKRDSKIYDYTFSNLFDFSKYKKTNNDW